MISNPFSYAHTILIKYRLRKTTHLMQSVLGNNCLLLAQIFDSGPTILAKDIDFPCINHSYLEPQSHVKQKKVDD